MTKESHFNTAVGVLDIAKFLLSGHSTYEWLSYLSKEDLTKFINEVKSILNNPQSTAKELSDSIYEWKQSAIAIASVELSEAYADETDEVKLTKPN